MRKEKLITIVQALAFEIGYISMFIYVLIK